MLLHNIASWVDKHLFNVYTVKNVSILFSFTITLGNRNKIGEFLQFQPTCRRSIVEENRVPKEIRSKD